jgi:hypothetical protein
MPNEHNLCEFGCDIDGDVIRNFNGCDWVVWSEISQPEPAWTNSLDTYVEELRRRYNTDIAEPNTTNTTQRRVELRVKSAMV